MQNHKHARVFGFREPEGLLYPNDLLDVMIRTKGKSFRMRPCLLPRKATYICIWTWETIKIPYISYMSIDPIPLIFPSRANRMDEYFYEAISFAWIHSNLTQKYVQASLKSFELDAVINGDTAEIRLVHPRYKFLDELTRLQYKETIGVKQ